MVKALKVGFINVFYLMTWCECELIDIHRRKGGVGGENALMTSSRNC